LRLPHPSRVDRRRARGQRRRLAGGVDAGRGPAGHPGDRPGGEHMPSLFIGAMVGTAFAKLVGPWWGFSELSTGAFAVVGMAAMFAAMGRAPLTAILLVFEITGTREYGL